MKTVKIYTMRPAIANIEIAEWIIPMALPMEAARSCEGHGDVRPATRNGSAISLCSIGTEIFPAIGRRDGFGCAH